MLLHAPGKERRPIMSTIDFAGARAHALKQLECDLDPTLVYHNIVHTRDDVLPMIDILAARTMPPHVLELLRTAASFHDVGFVEQYADHEAASIRIAHETLPRFGFDRDQITIIEGIIAATRLPQSPHTHLERIMADADLGILGQAAFPERNAALRAEMARHIGPVSDRAWYEEQVAFLHTHRYWTPAARSVLGPGKQRNLAVLQQRLAALRTPSDT